MQSYLEKHKRFKYTDVLYPSDGLSLYKSQKGWSDLYIGRNVVFSYRSNKYKFTDFPEKLHEHPFFEINIFKKGGVSYIAEQLEFFPQNGDIIIFPPNYQHTAHLFNEGLYERFVLYLSKELFSDLYISELPDVFSANKATIRKLSREYAADFLDKVNSLYTLSEKKNKSNTFLAYGLCLEIIYLITNCSKISNTDINPIPENVCRVHNYIDNNFLEIESVTELAKDLFYTREHISRVFKQYYNMSIYEYLIRKKIEYAGGLLKKGKSVSYACDSAGFRSMSAFIRAFRSIKGVLPSEYKIRK